MESILVFYSNKTFQFHFTVQQGFRVVQGVHSCLTLTLSKYYLSYFSYSRKTVAFLNSKDSVFVHWCDSVILLYLLSVTFHLFQAFETAVLNAPYPYACCTCRQLVWEKFLGLGIFVFLLLLLSHKEFEQRRWLMNPMRADSTGEGFGAQKPGMFLGMSRAERLWTSSDLGLEMWAGDISLQLVCQGSCAIKE